MAKRRKKRVSRSKSTGYPPFVWLLFGLAIGLSVAVAVYVSGRQPVTTAGNEARQPASMSNALDDRSSGDGDGKDVAVTEPEETTGSKRFTFYDILPNFEVVTPDESPEVEADVALRAVEEPGLYILQAGSFSTSKDADRRRAELALHGIESRTQRVKVNDRNYHRVYIGPIEDLDELNLLRSRLRAAEIDVFRIRLGD